MAYSTQPPNVAQYSCSLEAIVAVLGGKWKPGILINLMQQPLRFGELRRKLGPITEKMLAQQLRELDAHGVIERQDFHEVPPRTLYSLTSYGLTLRPIVLAMGTWGEQHIRHLKRREKTHGSLTLRSR